MFGSIKRWQNPAVVTVWLSPAVDFGQIRCASQPLRFQQCRRAAVLTVTNVSVGESWLPSTHRGETLMAAKDKSWQTNSLRWRQEAWKPSHLHFYIGTRRDNAQYLSSNHGNNVSKGVHTSFFSILINSKMARNEWMIAHLCEYGLDWTAHEMNYSNECECV